MICYIMSGWIRNFDVINYQHILVQLTFSQRNHLYKKYILKVTKKRSWNIDERQGRIPSQNSFSWIYIHWSAEWHWMLNFQQKKRFAKRWWIWKWKTRFSHHLTYWSKNVIKYLFILRLTELRTCNFGQNCTFWSNKVGSGSTS